MKTILLYSSDAHLAQRISAALAGGEEVLRMSPDPSGFALPGPEHRVLVVLVVLVALVALVVALVFDSVWATVMVFLDLPIALGGLLAAFWFSGAAFTREAAVGVILVIGLAVSHSVLLVDAALERRKRLGVSATAPRGLSGAEVLRAALDRSGMIVLVTLTTMASLVPLAIGTSSTTLFGAIALATAGGTIAGTVGAMFVLPSLVMGWGRGRAAGPNSGQKPARRTSGDLRAGGQSPGWRTIIGT